MGHGHTAYTATFDKLGAPRATAAAWYTFDSVASDGRLFFRLLPRDIRQLLANMLPELRQLARNTGKLRLEGVMAGGVRHYWQHISFDRHDNLLLCRNALNEVHVYDRAGTLLRQIGTKLDHNSPVACIADSRDRAYVVELYTTTRVSVFAKDGALLGWMSGPPGSSAQLIKPSGVALSRDESLLYVVDEGTHQVKRFRADTFAFVDNICGGHMSEPQGIAVLSTGHIAVSSRGEQQPLFSIKVPGRHKDGAYSSYVHVFDANGALLRQFGVGVGLYTNVGQLAVDGDDNLYVAAYSEDCVKLFTPQGRKLGRFGRAESRDKEYGPWGVAIDSQRSVAVLDLTGDCVQLFGFF